MIQKLIAVPELKSDQIPQNIWTECKKTWNVSFQDTGHQAIEISDLREMGKISGLWGRPRSRLEWGSSHRAEGGGVEPGRAASPERSGQRKFPEPSTGSERFREKGACGSADGPLERSAAAASTHRREEHWELEQEPAEDSSGSSAHSARARGSLATLLFSCSVMSDSLRLHGQQHTRFPCPSLSPGD